MKLLAWCLACLTGAMLGVVGHVNGPGDVVRFDTDFGLCKDSAPLLSVLLKGQL